MPALRFSTASDLYEAFATAGQDISAPARDEHPLTFMKALAVSDKPFDAVSFGAYLLPRHDAVQWAVECLGLAIPSALAKPDTALKAARTWLASPEEENRIAALREGMQGDPKQATTWIALAAGWAGPTVPFGDQHSVPAQPWMTARAVRASIAVALAALGNRERPDVLLGCVKACLAHADDRVGEIS